MEARRFVQIRTWLTLTEAAVVLGLSRQATHDRMHRLRYRHDQPGKHRTSPLQIAECCVMSDIAGEMCDCREVLRELYETRRTP